MATQRQASTVKQVETDGVQLSSSSLEASKDEQNPPLPEMTDVNEDEARVYRKIYTVLTILTAILVVLNIVQVCLLTYINHLWWIVGVPLAVFGLSLLWIGAIIAANIDRFRFFHWQDIKDGVYYLHRLFKLRTRRGAQEPIWPKYSARIGVLATILLNAILVEFIYLPIFALPAFKQVKWDITLDIERLDTPVVAVFDFPNKYATGRAYLPTENQFWKDVCDSWNDESGSCVSDEIQNFQGPPYPGGSNISITYAIYNNNETNTDYVGNGYNLYYPFIHDADDTGAILSLVMFLDPSLVDLFPQAWDCNIVQTQELNIRNSQQILLSRVNIIDKLNAFQRPEGCNIPQFQEYTSYQASVNDWGNFVPHANWTDCGFTSNTRASTYCTSAFQMAFTSTTITTYESKHGAGWIDILTAEGGVIGFVTFITWFFGIFVM